MFKSIIITGIMFVSSITSYAQGKPEFSIQSDTVYNKKEDAIGVVYKKEELTIGAFISQKELKKFENKNSLNIDSSFVDEFVLTPKPVIDFNTRTIRSTSNELIAKFDFMDESEACVIKVVLLIPESNIDTWFLRYCLKRYEQVTSSCRFWFTSELKQVNANAEKLIDATHYFENIETNSITKAADRYLWAEGIALGGVVTSIAISQADPVVANQILVYSSLIAYFFRLSGHIMLRKGGEEIVVEPKENNEKRTSIEPKENPENTDYKKP